MMTTWSPNGHPTSSTPTLPHIYFILSLFTLAHSAPHRTHSFRTSHTGSLDETVELSSTLDDTDEKYLFIKGQMEKYGYLRGHSSNLEFRNALKFFQEVLEVEQTGEVDSATLEAASQTRCTHSDVQKKGGRSKRFSLSKQAKWGIKHFSGSNGLVLKWYISDYTGDIDRVETRRVVRKAFELWSTQSFIKNEKKISLTFVEASSKEDADINILWAEGEHGDDYDFDGANGKIDANNHNRKENVLAHTFFPGYAFPLNGDIHFDDAETWEIDVDRVGPGKRFFPYVLAHEIGHSLGLGHSRKSEALMYPYYKNVPLDEIMLDVDDKCGVIWNFDLDGSSDFCLYVWLMSEIVDAHNGSVPNNNGVGPITSSRSGKKILKNTKIPRCSSNNSNIRSIAEEKLQHNLQLTEAQAKKYSEIVCNFLAGLHMWRAGPNYQPTDSTEKEFKGVSQEMNTFGGSSRLSVKRMLRHAEQLEKKKLSNVFDPEYFDDEFFENFFMEYLN